MRLPRLVGAMMFVAAQASCLETCKVGCDPKASNNAIIVDPFQDAIVHAVSGCSTCGHADLTTTWTYFGTPTPGGRVEVEVLYFCRDDEGESLSGTYNLPRSVPVPQTRLDYHEVGVRNVCGEDARIGFSTRLRNVSDVPIEATATIACPEFQDAPGNPASPSRTGR